ncbi:hypothetical protein [Oleidesulfovibrio sp.]|uniref:hypothetical protein n=1 Tax=Oleidesulfovibrio sp. TaxID=2909707 RepID=UPI003A865283
MIQRCVFAFAALTVLLVVCGCMTGSGSSYSAGNHTGGSAVSSDSQRVQVDERTLYNACLERCRRDDELARMTVKGCVPGCAMAREDFSLTGDVYPSVEACVSAVQDYRIEEQVRDAKAECDEQFSHLYHRKGCKDAADAYYRILFPALCKEAGRTE